MSIKSALYTGLVVHRRQRPRAHHLRYRVFSLLIDLDELTMLDRRLKLLSFNRPGALSFHESDHGDGGPLRQWVERQLQAAGLVATGDVQVLCYPRMFGYVFNPLTVYFCHDADGELAAIVCEVHNTHGERHAYVLPATGGAGERIRHACAKEFYVSPFLPMNCTYNFNIAPPAERVQIAIREADDQGILLTASFTGTRGELTDAALARALWRHPLMTLKVTLGIHWEALKLLTKGLRIYRHTPIDRR